MTLTFLEQTTMNTLFTTKIEYPFELVLNRTGNFIIEKTSFEEFAMLHATKRSGHHFLGYLRKKGIGIKQESKTKIHLTTMY